MVHTTAIPPIRPVAKENRGLGYLSFDKLLIRETLKIKASDCPTVPTHTVLIEQRYRIVCHKRSACWSRRPFSVLTGRVLWMWCAVS